MTSGSVLCHQHFLSQHFGWKTLSLLLNKQDQSQVIDSLSHSTFHVGLTWEVTPSDIFGAQGWALNGRGGQQLSLLGHRSTWKSLKASGAGAPPMLVSHSLGGFVSPLAGWQQLLLPAAESNQGSTPSPDANVGFPRVCSQLSLII